MKFEIDTEKKVITLKESVKLSDFLRELMYLNIATAEWSLDISSDNYSEIVCPNYNEINIPDPNKVTC